MDKEFLDSFGSRKSYLKADVHQGTLILLHSEWPKLYRVLAILSATGLSKVLCYTSEQSISIICFGTSPNWYTSFCPSTFFRIPFE